MGRVDLERARVRVLNFGGTMNPDVLCVADSLGRLAVVKDYAARPWWVRQLVAPWLLRREHAMLTRAAGTHGVPRALGRIDRLALALEYVEGAPLRRREHAHSVPPSYFAALEGILESLAARGLWYADLRSPTNLLYTRSGAPVVVDLAGASRRALPEAWLAWLDRRALAKLRRRFERHPGDAAPALRPAAQELRPRRARVRLLDVGPLADSEPVVLLADAGLPVESLLGVVHGLAAAGRRAIALELPFPGGSRPLRSQHQDGVEGRALWLADVAETLRLPRPFELVAVGWAGLVARAFAAQHPASVAALITVDTPLSELAGPFLDAWRAASRSPEALRAHLAARLAQQVCEPERAAAAHAVRTRDARALAAVYRALPVDRGADPDRTAPRLRDLPALSVLWLALGSVPDRVLAERPSVDEAPCVAPRRDLPLAAREVLDALLAARGDGYLKPLAPAGSAVEEEHAEPAVPPAMPEPLAVRDDARGQTAETSAVSGGTPPSAVARQVDGEGAAASADAPPAPVAASRGELSGEPPNEGPPPAADEAGATRPSSSRRVRVAHSSADTSAPDGESDTVDPATTPAASPRHEPAEAEATTSPESGQDYVTRALGVLASRGLLLASDVALPSVAALVAGEPIRGSWWSHPRKSEIYATLEALDDHSDVLSVKLIAGKVTLVHRRLFGAVLAVAQEAEAAVHALDDAAADLAARVREAGTLRTDAVGPWGHATKVGDAVRALERRLLLHTREIHTESGAHAKELSTWDVWRASQPLPEPLPSAPDARSALEACLPGARFMWMAARRAARP
jgi:hypothetical protein